MTYSIRIFKKDKPFYKLTHLIVLVTSHGYAFNLKSVQSVQKAKKWLNSSCSKKTINNVLKSCNADTFKKI